MNQYKKSLGMMAMAALLALAQSSRAGTLDLTGALPDITSTGLSANYVLGTAGAPNLLTVTGSDTFMAVTFADGSTGNLFGASYTLTAYVDDSGNLSTSSLTPSTLNINAVKVLDSSNNTLGVIGGLTGTLTNIGTNPDNDAIEFTMTSTNYGDLSGFEFGPFDGGNINITSTTFNGWNNAFLDSDPTTPNVTADTFNVVPTPAALGGGLMVLSGMLLLRKKLA